MITPDEIQAKEFTKGVRGYKEEEVDKFLDLITLDLDKLIAENAALRDTAKGLHLEIERYRASEHAVLETLESAKALMNEISVSAERRADIVLKNAELDAERIRREARSTFELMKQDAEDTQKHWDEFKLRFRNLLKNELDRFEMFDSAVMGSNDAERLSFYNEYASPPPASSTDTLIKTGNTAAPRNENIDEKSKTIKTYKRNGR